VVNLHKSVSAGNGGIFYSAAEMISKIIPMNKIKRASMENQLKIAGINETPEMYYATAIVELIKYTVLAILLYFALQYLSSLLAIIYLPLLIIGGLLSATKKLMRISTSIRKKKEQIEYELPRFVYSISQESESTRDVLSILEKHKDGFSPFFQREVAITIADMRTGNGQAALQRFESRVGSASLSEVVRGLIEMDKGNDTKLHWQILANKFSEIQKEELRKRAEKIPVKIHTLAGILFSSMVFTYLVIIITIFTTQINNLF
jgi:hypothetical protein